MMGYELPQRSSRGSRINKLVGEDAEADETFWGNDVWAEGEDEDYSTEAEEEDTVDSDFDEEENPDDEIHDAEEEKPTRRTRSSRSSFQEPKAPAPKRVRRVVEEKPVIIDEIVPMEVRSSTISKRVLSQELQHRYADEARKAQQKTNAPKVVVRMTQEQLLAEAVRIEVENTQSLNRLERIEEEKRADDMVPKQKYTGPAVRYFSSLHAPKLITFLNTEDFPSVFQQKPPAVRKPKETKTNQVNTSAITSKNGEIDLKNNLDMTAEPQKQPNNISAEIMTKSEAPSVQNASSSIVNAMDMIKMEKVN
ncbi:hypothetical protein THRCLA_20508 [Thraustotheca clavata]|uniref:Vps72/YL1 N-terminal domain-containing protein n=1 Tax=Thraustotheca clavata TaxID=74557 RepID=A0A1W0A6E7_9STRA|nr:hypothetical protein THRCLA_20508 [Thraustotheca clavata]